MAEEKSWETAGPEEEDGAGLAPHVGNGIGEGLKWHSRPLGINVRSRRKGHADLQNIWRWREGVDWTVTAS